MLWRGIALVGDSGRTGERDTSSQGDRIVRRILWAVAGLSLIATAVVMCLTFWPAQRAMPAAAASPTSDQLRAQDAVTRYLQAAESGDVAAVRGLTCADPTGTVARDLRGIESPTGYDVVARTHIDVFTRYAQTRDGAQIDIMYRLESLTPEGRRQADLAAGNYFGATYVLVDEGGELKVCGGAA